jgi:hypothetical protein
VTIQRIDRGEALRLEKMRSAKGIGFFAASLALMFAAFIGAFVLAHGVDPTPERSRYGEPVPPDVAASHADPRAIGQEPEGAKE